MNSLRVASRARNRLTASAVVRSAGTGFAVGAGVGAAYAVVSTLLMASPAGMPLLALAAGAGGGLLIGAASGLVGRPSKAAAAAELDRRLGLKDAISTAVEIAASGDRSGLATVAMADGERAAGTASLAKAIPITFGRPWAIGGVALLAGVAALQWLPPGRGQVWLAGVFSRPSSTSPAPIDNPEQLAERVAAVRAVAEAAGGPSPQPGTDDPAAALRAIESELQSGRIPPAEARARTTQAIEQIARNAEERAREQQAADAAFRDLLARQQRLDSTPDGALTRSLRNGDLTAAQQALSDLARQWDAISPEDRETLAQQLRELASDLRQTPAENPPLAAETQE
ncbi:MAG: hypothetical protein IOD15_08830, partial [Phycisphaerales bacterium]|nr:hypothetical protein [Phycisphaerales bacterium]